MKKLLPMSIKNAPISALMYAYPYALIAAYPKYNAWLHENYVLPCVIKPYVDDDSILCMHYLDACNFAEYNTAKPFMTISGYEAKDLVNEDIVLWIKKRIDNAEYVILFVDEYYLPECGMGGKEHYLHEELIYGYDDDKQTIRSVGMNSSWHFSEIENRYDDIRKAYNAGVECSNHGNLEWAEKNRVRIVRMDKLTGQYPYNPMRFMQQLKKYLYGVVDEDLLYISGLAEHGDVYLGTKYYEYLVDEFTHIDASKMFRHIHHLYEHKLMLCSSIRFMGQYEGNPQIIEDSKYYEQVILSKMTELRMLTLKNKIRNTQQTRDKILRFILDIAAEEKLYIESFISRYNKEEECDKYISY